MQPYRIEDITLAEEGSRRAIWARQNMPILAAIKRRLVEEQPFKGHKIGICLHVQAKSAVWIETLMADGDGNPIEVMDLGLALQTFSHERIVMDSKSLVSAPPDCAMGY